MKAPARNAVFSAVIAGQLAGLCMAASMMVASVLMGRPVWEPFRVMSGLVVGEAAVEHASARELFVGWLAHQTGPSYLWSRVFGLLVGYATSRIGWRRALLSGLAVGVLAEVIDVYVLMPSNPHGDIWFKYVPTLSDWMAHLVFGAALGLFYARLQERPPEQRVSAAPP